LDQKTIRLVEGAEIRRDFAVPIECRVKRPIRVVTQQEKVKSRRRWQSGPRIAADDDLGIRLQRY